MATLGSRIREIRKQRNLTQEELAFRCGYKNRASINKIELDKYNVGLPVIRKIAEALNCDPDYLVFGDEDDREELKVEINRLFDLLPAERQDAVLALLRSMIKEQ